MTNFSENSINNLVSSIDAFATVCHKCSKEHEFWPREELLEDDLIDRITESLSEGPLPDHTEDYRDFVADIVHLARTTAPANIPEKIALVETELAEITEAYRHGDPASDKIPAFRQSEEEVADAIIRLCDLAAHENMRLGEAIKAKIAYNLTRPRKHGKLF